MATYTSKFNLGDVVYIKRYAELEGTLIKGQVAEIIITHTAKVAAPAIIRYKVDAGAIVQRKTRWLECELLTEAEARALAKRVLHKKNVQAKAREDAL